MNYLWFKVHTY